MVAYFFHRFLKVSALGVGEQTVRSGALRNVLHVLTTSVQQFYTVTGGDVLRITPRTTTGFDISALLNMSMSAVSHQLRVLRGAKLVKGTKEGKEVLYSLDDDHVTQILACGFAHVNEE